MYRILIASTLLINACAFGAHALQPVATNPRITHTAEIVGGQVRLEYSVTVKGFITTCTHEGSYYTFHRYNPMDRSTTRHFGTNAQVAYEELAEVYAEQQAKLANKPTQAKGAQ